MSFIWLRTLLYSDTVDTATGSNSGLSVLLKGTPTRAGIEPPTLWLRDGPATHRPTVTALTKRSSALLIGRCSDCFLSFTGHVTKQVTRPAVIVQSRRTWLLLLLFLIAPSLLITSHLHRSVTFSPPPRSLCSSRRITSPRALRQVAVRGSANTSSLRPLTPATLLLLLLLSSWEHRWSLTETWEKRLKGFVGKLSIWSTGQPLLIVFSFFWVGGATGRSYMCAICISTSPALTSTRVCLRVFNF